MSVITISRGTMSGGQMLAEELSKALGFRCVDREVIVEKAAASGVSQEELHDAFDKPPTFLERFRHRKYLYLALIQAALAEEVKTGKVIYHGNAGHLLLRSGGPVFRVRIIAPLEFRISMARKRLGFQREEAIDYIRQKDVDRQKWTQYLYGVDWTDPNNYDMVVNLEYIEVSDAVEALAVIIRKQACFAFSDTCRAMMVDHALASRVKADLALNSSTRHIEFEILAKGGRVTVRGKLPDVNLADEVKRVATAVDGVEEVSLNELVSATPD